MIHSNSMLHRASHWLSSHLVRLFLSVPPSSRRSVIEIHEDLHSDERVRMCLTELEQSHSLINWYDDVVMRKKSWCVAIWIWVTAFGVFQRDTLIVLLGLATVFGFALTELVLRRYQRRYVVRAEELETMLSTGDLDSYHFAMATTPARSERRKEIWYALKQPHFTIYYSFYGSHSVGYALILTL